MNYRNLNPGDVIIVKGISSICMGFQSIIDMVNSTLPELPAKAIIMDEKGDLDTPIALFKNGEALSVLYLEWEK